MPPVLAQTESIAHRDAGFEIVLTHWFYLYLPWFFPFVVLALVAPLPAGAVSGGAPSAGPVTPSDVESPPVAA